MTTRLLLTRHGASHHKEQSIIGGPMGCTGLTEEGRREVESLGNRLATRDVRPDVILSSDLRRANETATIIAQKCNLPEPTRDSRLRTWLSPADWDGKSTLEFQSTKSAIGGGIYRPFEDGNESWAELVIRVGSALEEAVSRHRGQTILVVAHTEVVNAALIAFGNLPLHLGFGTKVSNASLTEWTTDGDPDSWPRPQWTLVRFNDAAHLEKQKALFPSGERALTN